MYCNQEIIISEEKGKWLTKMGVRMTAGLLLPATATATNGQKQQQAPITVHQLKIWLATLEIAEVHIDKQHTEAETKNKNKSKNKMITKEEHCKGCGEWLPDDVDICPTCGMLQVK